ncbi:MAG: type II secretion system F family protein [Christensenellales bacterium]
MPGYFYKGKTIDNVPVSGKLFAFSEAELYKQLKAQNIFAYWYKEERVIESAKKKISFLDLADFSRQLGSMLSAGIPMLKVLTIMRDRNTNKALGSVYATLHTLISKGNNLTDAMEECSPAFPALLINMLRAGEANGQLDKTATKMAEHYEKEHKTKAKIKSAMAYPIVLLCLTVVITLVIFTFVLPQFIFLFKDMELPLPTRISMFISNAIVHYWYLILLGVALIVGIVSAICQKPAVKIKIDRFKLKLPKIGKLVTIICSARFARTLCSLYSSGVPMIEAISISVKTIGNTYIESQFGKVISSIKEGNSLSYSLQNVIGLDAKLTSVIYIGEESGKLDEMLTSLSNSFEYEADSSTQKLLTYVEPALIIFMALIVGSVILSVMLPILTMYQSIG